MADLIKIAPHELVVDALQLQALIDVCKQQLMFPAWKKANPHRTAMVEAAIAHCSRAESDRRLRGLAEFQREVQGLGLKLFSDAEIDRELDAYLEEP